MVLSEILTLFLAAALPSKGSQSSLGLQRYQVRHLLNKFLQISSSGFIVLKKSLSWNRGVFLACRTTLYSINIFLRNHSILWKFMIINFLQNERIHYSLQLDWKRSVVTKLLIKVLASSLTTQNKLKKCITTYIVM